MSRLSDLEAKALMEKAQRSNLAVEIFRPFEGQSEIFRKPRSKYNMIGGGNRGGKTLCCMVLVAAFAMDKKVTLHDGEVVRIREDRHINQEEPLIFWLCSIDQRHIGNVIHDLLLRAGAFKVCRDPITKQLRPYDRDRDEPLGIKPRPSPPLIPARYVKHVSWESKRDKVFNRIDLQDPATGKVIAEIHAFTTGGEPPQGKAVDFVLFDEQAARENSGWLNEMQARLVDREGVLYWSSWADSDNEELERFNNMIESHIERGNHHIAKKITLTMEGNKSLGKKAVQEFLDGIEDENERNARNLGIFSKESLRMFPLFSKDVHSAQGHGDRLSEIVEDSGGEVPSSWTRYLALDPGTQNPGALVVAMPPPDEFGGVQWFVPCQEFYPGRADPIELAKLIRRSTRGVKFYSFLIDKRAGRQQTMGLANGTRVADAYSRAFESVGLKCHTTKHQFVFGSDDVGGRQLMLNELMHPTGVTGPPRLRIVTSHCPKLCDQLRKCKKKLIGKEPQDDRKAPGNPHDLVDCLEYIVASSPKYRYLKPTAEDGTAAYQYWTKRLGRINKKGEETIQIGTRY